MFFKKNRNFILGFLMVSLIALVLFLGLPLKREEPKEVAIVRSALTWMDSQKDEDGLYKTGYQCVDEKCAESKESFVVPREHSFVIWARYKHYKQTKKEEQLNALKNDLSNFLIHTELPLQINFWNCRLVYEIFKDELMPEEVRRSSQNVCLSTKSVIPNYDFKTDEEISDLAKKITAQENFQLPNLVEGFGMNAALASESIYLFKLTEKDFYSLEAKRYFKNSLYGYSSSIYNDAILGIASLDLYKQTKEEYYFDLASYLYNNLKIEAYKMEDKEKNPYSFSYALFFVQELSQYQDLTVDKENLKDIVVNNGFDEKDYPAHTYGLGAFINFKGGDYYSVKENAFITGLLNNLIID